MQSQASARKTPTIGQSDMRWTNSCWWERDKEEPGRNIMNKASDYKQNQDPTTPGSLKMVGDYNEGEQHQDADDCPGILERAMDESERGYR